MSDQEVIDILPRLAVLSRALPNDKSRLVRLAQSCELVVGMTGDGINDAPALKLSDVGFAMGSGNDVAKEAGDIVILDNNLSSVVKAVLYGRNIFKSIRKFLTFQLTMNFSSALVCMIAPLLGYETPITVSQMLWVNMIMDTLGGLAFAGEAPHKRIMKEKPKRRDEAILNNYMIHQILISGGFSVIISLLFLKSELFTSHFRSSENDLVLLSAFFALLIFLSVVQCINSRTDRLNIFSGISKNPTFVLILLLISAIQISLVYFGGEALRATPLYPNELLFTLLVSLCAIPIELLRKMLWRFSGHTTGF
jgi:magnesium-transporting ATPase (P-type)